MCSFLDWSIIIEVSTRELKQNAGELLRLVRYEGRVISITDHGKVVAELAPPTLQSLSAESEEAWEAMQQLSQDIAEAWSVGVSAVEALSETREFVYEWQKSGGTDA